MAWAPSQAAGGTRQGPRGAFSPRRLTAACLVVAVLLGSVSGLLLAQPRPACAQAPEPSGPEPLMSGVYASPDPFSPNGDGVDDATVIHWTYDLPHETSVKVYRSGLLVKTILDHAWRDAGPNTVTWRGGLEGGGTATDGAYTVKIVPEDEWSHYAASLTVTVVDCPGEPPPPPHIATPGGLTNQAQVAVSGTASCEAASVRVYVNGDLSATAAVSGGSWSTAVGLAEGSNQVTARAMNSAGESGPSTPVLFTRDSTPPAAPWLRLVPSLSGNPSVAGGTEPGARVTLSRDGAELCTLTAGGDGRFSRPVSVDSGRATVFTARATDAAGNTGLASSALTVTDHVVRPGDTLGQVAYRFYQEYGRYPDIADLNGPGDPDSIYPGWHLFIADPVSFAAPAPRPPLPPESGSQLGSSPQSGTQADPVNTSTGNFAYQAADLAVGGRMPLEFVRTYNSLSDADGPLGPGWSHSFAVRLVALAGGEALILRGDGRQDLYRPGADGGFDGPPGVGDVLEAGPGEGWTLVTPEGRRLGFEPPGLLVRVFDRNLTQIELTYAEELLTRVENSSGYWLALAYDASGRLTRVSDPLGRSVAYRYGASGRLEEAVDAAGGRWRYTYDDRGLLTGITAPDGTLALANAYDDACRVTAQTDAVGGVTRFAYHPEAGYTVVVSPDGAAARHEFDGEYRLARQVDALGQETRFGYDAGGRRSLVVDPAGGERRFSFDGPGRLIEEADPLGNRTRYTYSQQGDLLRMEDPAGNRWEYERDAAGNLVRLADPTGGVAEFEYDGRGNLVRAVAPGGGVTRYGFDAHDNSVKVDDPVGSAWLYEYDAAGLVRAVVDPAGGRTESHWDALQRLVEKVDPAGGRWRQEYDPLGRLAAVVDPLGNRTAMAYDSRGLLVRHADPAGGVRRYSYDECGRLVAEVDERGGTTAYRYDAAGRPIEATDPAGFTWSYAYDPRGLLVSTRSPLGATTTLDCDAAGRLTRIIDPVGGATRRCYDARGLLVRRVGPDGAETRYDYDAAGRLNRVTDPLGHVQRYYYDAAGRLVSAVDPSGAETRYAYDLAGRLIEAIDPGGGVSRRGYDGRGLLRWESDPAGGVRVYAYDAAGRLLSETDPAGVAIRYELDAAGRLTAEIDGAGNRTAYAYDPAGRLRAVTDPLGAVVRYQYTAAGDLAREVDPLGRAWRYEYGPRGEVLSATDPLARETTYAYDSEGRLVERRAADGSLGTYRYDPAGRLQSVLYGDGTGAAFDHDAAGRVVAMRDPLGGTEYAYDAAGRLTRVEDFEGRVVSYGYDPRGLVTRLAYPDGSEVGYEYDASGRLVELRSAEGTTRYAYDPCGRVTETLRPGGLETACAYDPAGRVRSLVHQGPQGLMAAFGYAYDETGRCASLTETWGQPERSAHGAGPKSGDATEGEAPRTWRTNFAYDAAGRLAAEVSERGESRSYAYDASGNRLRMSVIPAGGEEQVWTYTYDEAGQLLEAAGSWPGGWERVTCAFDQNGNLVAQRRTSAASEGAGGPGPGSGGAGPEHDAAAGGEGPPEVACAGEETQYHYDDAGHLIGVEGAGGLALNYVYDGAGRKVARWGSRFPEGLPPGIAMLLREGPGHGRAQGKGLESGKWWQEWGSGVPGPGHGGEGGGDGKGKGGGHGQDGHPGGGGHDRPAGPPGKGRGDKLGLRARLGLEGAFEGQGPLDYVRYVNDVLEPAARVLAEYDGEGALRQRFVYGPDRLAAEGGPSGTVYPLVDALGSPRLLAGASGRWLAALDYEAFGTPEPGPGPGGSFAAASAKTGNPFGFCGELYDPQSGLLYLRARHYAPETGRFTSPDPYPPDACRPAGLNRYAYCAGDPVNFTDPLGWMGIEAGGQAQGATGPGLWERLARGFTSAGLGFIPVLGDVKDIQEALSGVDLVTGERLALWERLLSGVLVLVPVVSGSLIRGGVKAADAGLEALQASERASEAAGELAGAGRAAEAAGDVAGTGQWHHVISTRVGEGIKINETLAGQIHRGDPQFLIQAVTLESHRGYQRWHRALDREIVVWLERNPLASREEFIHFLNQVYHDPAMVLKFGEVGF